MTFADAVNYNLESNYFVWRLNESVTFCEKRVRRLDESLGCRVLGFGLGFRSRVQGLASRVRVYGLGFRRFRV